MLHKPEIIVQDNRKYMVLDLDRLYCGYNTNTNSTAFTQDEWTRFTYPSEGITIYRSKNWEVDPTAVRFTYKGTEPHWFKISANCNIKKTDRGGASRDVEFQWRWNGIPVGSVRETHMSSKDAEIISGDGQMVLQPDDYIEPWCRNIENSDDCIMYNCSYDIVEDVTLALNA